MAVQVNLLHQFILELVPDLPAPNVSHIQGTFDAFKEDPLPVVAAGLTHIQKFMAMGEPASSGTFNGIMFGIFIASVSESEDYAEIFKGFLENQQRGRGEHVVNLSQFKAKRST